MKNIFTIACLSSIQDAATGLHSFINCIETGTTTSLPNTLPGFVVVSRWFFPEELGEVQVSAILHRPDGSDEVVADAGKIEIKENHTITISIHIDHLNVNEAGQHHLQVKIQHNDNEPILGHKYPLTIVVKKEEEPVN